MKLTTKVKLIPTPDQEILLTAVTRRFNQAADWISGELFNRKIANKVEAQKILYRDVRDKFGLSSQTAILAIHRACDAYKRDMSKRPRFRQNAAITYDVRTSSFKGDKVSLLTLEGRIRVPMIVADHHAERMRGPKGQCDLIHRDRRWYLFVSVDVAEERQSDAKDFVGVDLGIANIATDSDGNQYSGKSVERIRRKHNLQRKRLQKKGTRGSKKKLRRVAGKEARFRRHENHVVSKAIVENAKRTGRGIALEDLKGIRRRVTARGGDARNRLSGWSFAQLGTFIDYKARLSGVSVIYVDPRDSSRTCAECGHCEKSNRKTQGEFVCKSCGRVDHADRNAARNHRARALLSVPQDWTGHCPNLEIPCL